MAAASTENKIQELTKQIAELEKQLQYYKKSAKIQAKITNAPEDLRLQAEMSNEIVVTGVHVQWFPEQGRCLFRGLPVAMMWVDSTLASLMSGVQAMVGTKRFYLALQAEGRKSVEADWQIISRYDDFREGFAAIAINAAIAGWGQWQLQEIDYEKKICIFRVYNNWEGLYQKALGVCWGSGILAGKLAGFCNKLFNVNCWADQTAFVAKDDIYDEFYIAPSHRVLEEEIDNLLTTDQATRADMAVALEKLKKEIAERKLVETQLIAAKEFAEQANYAKSEFLSNMSHELRTPLNAIMGFSQILLDRDEKNTFLDKTQRRWIHEIYKGGDHLLHLINDILDLSKIESGKIEVSIEPVILNKVITEAITLVQTLADKNKIQIFFTTSHIQTIVAADCTRLKQVILNLLSNAIKYNRQGGMVEVCLQQQPRVVRIEIHDTGLGIAPDKITELFKPFNRLGYENSGIDGSGIGLALTKRIVELMGGKIGVESQPNEGSTFWLEVPLCQVEEDNLFEQRHKTNNLICPNRKKILYIEDNPANLNLMEAILEEITDVEMLSAHNAELGIEIAETQLPEVILMDINLPGMSGYQALKKLQETNTTQHIPVVAVTANATKSDIARGKQAGFIDYVTKPFDLHTIEQVLGDLLNI
jgi:signal transduction histidine kinase